MAEITAVAGRAWVYSHNIGRNGAAGMGFSQPVSIAAPRTAWVYVTNRATEQNPGGIRVTKFTVEQEYIGEFGRQGLAYGDKLSPAPSPGFPAWPWTAPATFTLPTSGSAAWPSLTPTATPKAASA